MKQKEMFVLEWSPSQKAFHIQLLDVALEANRRRFSEKPEGAYDWVPLYIGTYKACEIVADHNVRKMEAKTTESARWTH
jgi:hypothetical protein